MVWFVDEAIKQNIKTTDVYADAAPKSAVVMSRGVAWLKKADRFKIELPLIPHGAEERFAASLERFAHGVFPPSRFTIVEYEHFGNYNVQPDLTRALSTKRIALCVELDSIHAVYESAIQEYERDPSDQGGLMVWAINYFDEKKEWEFAPGAAIIPKAQANKFFEKSALKSRFARTYEWVKSRMAADSAQTAMEVTYIEMLPEICEKLGKEHRQRAIHETNMDAVWVALGFFSTFGCENVKFDAEARTSSIFLPERNINVPVDPYHGFRKEDYLGSAQWSQESSFKSHV